MLIFGMCVSTGFVKKKNLNKNFCNLAFILSSSKVWDRNWSRRLAANVVGSTWRTPRIWYNIARNIGWYECSYVPIFLAWVNDETTTLLVLNVRFLRLLPVDCLTCSLPGPGLFIILMEGTRMYKVIGYRLRAGKKPSMLPEALSYIYLRPD